MCINQVRTTFRAGPALGRYRRQQPELVAGCPTLPVKDVALQADFPGLLGVAPLVVPPGSALHLLQSALVHVNTLLMQQVLADQKWADTLTDADRRALSPLFWTHVNPYGRFELDMNSRLDLDLTVRTKPGPRTPADEPAAVSG
jgi:hypothetical protein